MNVPTIDHAAAARRIEDEGVFVLDVREPHEWDAGHIPAAVHVPLGDLDARIAELPTDRPIIVACKSGGRSAHATAQLTARGYDATNLAGGTTAWHAAKLPLEPADGFVA